MGQQQWVEKNTSSSKKSKPSRGPRSSRSRGGRYAEVFEALRGARSLPDVFPLPIPPAPQAANANSSWKRRRCDEKFLIYFKVLNIIQVLNRDWGGKEAPQKLEDAK